jgi:peptidoglycan/xylan/chitin deacetylase (PgdA/CDA1 family)
MEFSVFLRDTVAEKVVLEQLGRDSRAARLSRTFQLYYRIRPLVPLALRRLLQRNRKVEVAEQWYIAKSFFASLASVFEPGPLSLPIIHPWPNGRRFAFVLTHDVDTKTGFQNIPKLAKIEEDLGLRSAWYIVPHKYKIDEGLIRDLQSRSFEIGIHGYNHDGRLFCSERTFKGRAAAINAALEKYGAVGFRSPMVHRNLEWLQQLSIQYDTSCFDVDPFQPMPGGVGSIWPFVAGKFVELPYTLPQDHTLFVALDQPDARIWESKRDFLVRHHGMLLMLTHPDYLATSRHLDLYRRFLATTQEIAGCWHALPRQVSNWWRQREQSGLAKAANGHWSIQGPARTAGAVAEVGACDGELSIRHTS